MKNIRFRLLSLLAALARKQSQPGNKKSGKFRRITKEDLSAKLEGLEYGQEIPRELAFQADDSGLVVIYRSSQGFTLVNGAICDQTRRWVITITPNGLCDEEHVEEPYNKIRLLQNLDGYRWVYETTIQHMTFDMMENGEKCCRGIIFALSDL